MSSQSYIKNIDLLLSFSKQQSHSTFLQEVPQPLINFLKAKEIPAQQVAVPIPRFIRLKPDTKLSKKQVGESLRLKQQEIEHIDENFYAILPECKINGSEFYEKNLLYGMDYSSAMPIRCLDVEEGHRVLELCSAPGNKSMYLADKLDNVKIIGVQINHNRANVMKNLIKKYSLNEKIQVVEEDGVKYQNEAKFDRVLVDVECTHEGSIKHIKKFMKENKPKKATKNELKYEKWLTLQQEKQFEINNSNPYTSKIKKLNQWTFEDFEERFLDKKKLQNLKELQMGLLTNGFKQLKEEGILVYSTCSFDPQQNQNIIEEFMKKQPTCTLLDASELKSMAPFEEGRLKKTIKFSPSVSRCGGMFIAKMKKQKIEKFND